MKGLKGKNVLITGSSQGIGEATAIRFAEEGANVAINFFSSEGPAKETRAAVEHACSEVRKAGCKDLIIQADVSKEDDIDTMFQTVLEEWAQIDILINNAGIQKEYASHEMPIDAFDKVLATNLRGAFLCSQRAIQHFMKRNIPGVILNNSSVHEIIPKPGFVSYAVSKGGMENMTKTLALEYADKNIRVNGVGPGATLTPINPWNDDPEKRSQIESHIPIKRAAKPEEIADVFVFLASEEASYITGQTIFVDGGLTLYPSFKENWTS
jgi:glucose 1-dehydrogenase